ncbi:MAG: porin [Proteobacteria bacterium]|nr:porin [Pseudomonadota bacterium]
MGCPRSASYIVRTGLAALVLALPNSAMAQTIEEANTIAELKALIRAQQKQLDNQAQAISELQQALEHRASQPPSSLAPPAPTSLIKTRSNKLDVTLYGQLNRALMSVDDGRQDTWRHVDADVSGSRFGIKARKSINSDFSLAARFELEYQPNGSNFMSMEVDDHDDGLQKRHVDISLTSGRFGRISLGQGDTASNATSEADLSGLKISGIHVGVHDLPAAFVFHNETADDYSTATGSIETFFNSMDGLSRRARLRYDSPNLQGFTLSGSLTEKNGNDLALRCQYSLPTLKIKSALAYAHPGKGAYYEQTNGSLSVRHASGTSLTLAGGRRHYQDALSKNASFYYSKIAYEKEFWALGSTVFGIDYGRWNDLAHDATYGDEAVSYGIGLVQNFREWNTEIYGAYRIYSLERSRTTAEYNDIRVFWSGLRLQF